MALGLYAKACKQFRTIVMVGEAGFGGEMTVLFSEEPRRVVS